MFSFNVDAFHRIEWLTFAETNGSLTDAFHKKLPLTKIYSLYLKMDPHYDARRQIFSALLSAL